jgi:hypothetical protein
VYQWKGARILRDLNEWIKAKSIVETKIREQCSAKTSTADNWRYADEVHGRVGALSREIRTHMSHRPFGNRFR